MDDQNRNTYTEGNRNTQCTSSTYHHLILHLSLEIKLWHFCTGLHHKKKKKKKDYNKTKDH